MKSRVVAILAGNYQQYLAFCIEQGWPVNRILIRNGERIKTVYCDSVEKMCGWFPDEFIRTGTWWDHPMELISRFDFFRTDTEIRRGRLLQELSRDTTDNRSTGS